MSFLATPTTRLLNSSTVVAISGGLRLHVAFLLAGLAIRIPEYIAFALIVYATYTLDRALDCKEDAINRSDLCGADRNIGIAACIVTFIAGTILLMNDGIWLAPFFPFIVGYLYTRGVRLGSRTIKLKAGAGIKNIIIGITWGGTIALIVGQWASSLMVVGIVFFFFGSKIFVTSCVNDFKDVRGDIAAGIRTLPACLGEYLTKIVLILILFALYGVMAYALLQNIICHEWIILVFGLVITVVFLMIYSSAFENESSIFYRKMREFVISWESVVSLGIRACVAS